MRLARSWLAAGCALATLSAAIPALAQPAAQQTPDAKAAAANDETGSTVVDTVIVTTERRASNVQDTPLAITAYTDKTRENLGITTVQSLAQFSPGVSYSAAADRPTIRGVGRQNNSHGLNSPVAQYIDGFYESTVQDINRRPIFIDRNEVVSGPQGALAGKGSAAGAIYTYTKRPKDEFGAELGGYYNNYERWGIEGTITGPVTDWMRYRINAARYVQDKGFYTNLEDGNTEGDRFGNRTLLDLMLAGNVGKNVDWFLKGSGFWYYETLRDGYSTAPYSTGTTNPCIQTAFANTGALAPSAAFGTFDNGSATQCGAFAAFSNTAPGFNPAGVIYGNGIRQNPTAIGQGGDPRTFISDYHSDLHLENYRLVTFDTTWHAPLMDVRYIVGASRYHYTQSSDNDGTPVTSMVLPAAAPTPLGGGLFLNTTAPRVVNPAGINIYQEEPSWYSNELTFASTWKGPLQGILGLYQYNQYTNQPTADIVYQGMPEFATPYAINSSFAVIGQAPANVNGPMAQYGNQKTRQNTWAAFTQWDYKFNDKWTLTAGVRYNADKQRAFEQTRIISNNPLVGGGATNVTYNIGIPVIGQVAGLAQINGPFAIDLSAVAAPGFAVLSANSSGVFPTVPNKYRLVDPAQLPGAVASGTCNSGANTNYIYAGIAVCGNQRVEFGGGVKGVSVDPFSGNRQRESEGDWHALTGGVSLSYKPDEDSLIYLHYARGYRPGGFGATTAGFMPLNPYADKEDLNTYELGGKFTLWNKLQLNADLFYYDYKNIQLQLSRFERCIIPGDISTCTPVSSVVNLPSAVNQGFELTSRWYVTPDLQLTLNYGYLDAHIKNGLLDNIGFQDTNDPAALLPGAAARRLTAITCNVTVPVLPALPAATSTCRNPNAAGLGILVDPITQQQQYTQDISGNELPNAPHNKIAANVSYTFHLAKGNLTTSYSYIWRSSAYSQPDVFEEKINNVPAYSQSDARLIFRQKDGDYSVILFGTNIFNQQTYESGGSTRRGSGYTQTQGAACPFGICAQQQIYYRNYVLLPPRVFGVEFLKKFR